MTNGQERHAALEQFLAAHETRAYRMAYLATGNHHDALDIVQDAMLKLVRRYAQRDAQTWPALFTRVIQNALVDWHRRSKVRRRWRQWFGTRQADDEQEQDPIAQAAQPGAHEPDKQVGYERAMRQLDTALRDLPLRQQQAFLLRQWEGLDVAQTAKAMGISEGSVKTHYARAVQSLRRQLEGHW